MEEQPKNILKTILKSSSVIATHLNLGLKPYKMSLQQFYILCMLKQDDGRVINLSDIQEKMPHKMSNATRVIDKLIDKGMACKIVSSSNRRKIELFITEKGIKILESLYPIIKNIENQLLHGLSDTEEHQLYNYLIRIH